MRERSQEPTSPESLDDLFEPALSELIDEEDEETIAPSSAKRALVEKRRRAELRLEQRRLRDELGDYDLELDDF